MKRTLSLILAIIMVLTGFSTGTVIFAQDNQESDQSSSTIRVDFDAVEKSVKLGDIVTLTATAQYINDEGNLVKTPAAELDVTIDKVSSGKTDKNGKLLINAQRLGVFDVSLKGMLNGSDILAPHCTLNVTSNLENYVDKEIEECVKTVVSQKTAYTIDDAINYLTYLKSDYDMSKFNDGFVKSIQDTLDKNGGRLPKTELYGYDYTLGIYAAVIQILDELDYNPENFGGINLVSQFESLDLGDVKYQPYYYRVAIEAAVSIDNISFAKAIADDLIETYYTVGSGLNYFGYSCDNTAYFLTSIAYFKDSYKFYVNDAKKLIRTYATSKGYTYDPVFDASADSTATALMAYSSVGEVEKAFDAYKLLVENYEEKTGSFGNAITLNNCLLALEYFSNLIFSEDYEHPEHINKLTSAKNPTCTSAGESTYTCVVCSEITKVEIPLIEHTVVTDKAVSATYSKTGLTQGSHCSVCNTVIVAQKTVAKKKPTISKLTAGKKQFKISWKKASSITGYEIQSATDKSFKKSKKTTTIKGVSKTSATVKGLKAKKTYYVRVRTYKTTKGKKVYSSWSAIKTVKTK